MRISDWSSDVCSSDLFTEQYLSELIHRLRINFRCFLQELNAHEILLREPHLQTGLGLRIDTDTYADDPQITMCSSQCQHCVCDGIKSGIVSAIATINQFYLVTCRGDRSEEHTSELQSLMRISYAVFCLKKKTQQ